MTSPFNGAPKSWWAYIKEIKVIQPDRIVAIVDKEMVDRVKALPETESSETDPLVERADVCSCKENNDNVYNYKEASAILHEHNFRAAIDSNPKQIKMDSKKTTHSHAPIQLTVTTNPVDGKDGKYYLLDADIDEHSGLSHIGDSIRHSFGASTNPFRIRNMLPTAYPEIKEFGYHKKGIDDDLPGDG